MMLNVGKLRSGDRRYVLEDIRAVVQAAGQLPVKVILEAPLLSDDQLRLACDLSIQAGAAFVKTSTGWHPNGTTLPMIRLLTAHVGGAIQIKAAGGIRDLASLVEMHRLGVARFGINLSAAVAIVTAVSALPGGAVEA